jgi:DNA-directed RNA polymerase sigma subunit (sigma70/sigma32)
MSYDKNILSTDTEIGIKFNLTSERIKQIRKKTIEEIKKSLKYTGYNSNYEGNLF